MTGWDNAKQNKMGLMWFYQSKIRIEALNYWFSQQINKKPAEGNLLT